MSIESDPVTEILVRMKVFRQSKCTYSRLPLQLHGLNRGFDSENVFSRQILHLCVDSFKVLNILMFKSELCYLKISLELQFLLKLINEKSSSFTSI